MVQSTNCFSHKSKELLGQVVPRQLVVVALGWRTARLCWGRAGQAAARCMPSICPLFSVLNEGPGGSLAPVRCWFGSPQPHCWRGLTLRTGDAVVLEPSRDLSSAEDSRFNLLSKCTKTAVSAGAGLSLEWDRSEQPRAEANWGSVCLGCWGALLGKGHPPSGRVRAVVPQPQTSRGFSGSPPVGSWAHPQFPRGFLGSSLPGATALSSLGSIALPHVVLGLQGWCPLPLAFPILGVAVLSFKTPRTFLWAVHLGL